MEVDRPDRRQRRSKGKSDPLDAIAAARAALAGTAAGNPKTRIGPVEAIRALQVARRGAVKARTAALNRNAWDNLQDAAMIRGGHDLIWTLTHSPEGSCPLCLPWLGRVLSLTGATTGQAAITDATGQAVNLPGRWPRPRQPGGGTRTAGAAGSRTPTVTGSTGTPCSPGRPTGRRPCTRRASGSGPTSGPSAGPPARSTPRCDRAADDPDRGPPPRAPPPRPLR